MTRFHKCERKQGLIWECLVIDSYIFCKSCGERLEENQIFPAILERIKDKWNDRRK